MDHCRLARSIERICRERGISEAVGLAAFAEFIEVLHEISFKADQEDGSLMFQTYRTLGDEAAYHLAGLVSDGDDGMAFEELKYVDSSVGSFRTAVQRWEMERRGDQESGE